MEALCAVVGGIICTSESNRATLHVHQCEIAHSPSILTGKKALPFYANSVWFIVWFTREEVLGFVRPLLHVWYTCHGSIECMSNFKKCSITVTLLQQELFTSPWVLLHIQLSGQETSCFSHCCVQVTKGQFTRITSLPLLCLSKQSLTLSLSVMILTYPVSGDDCNTGRENVEIKRSIMFRHQTEKKRQFFAPEVAKERTMIKLSWSCAYEEKVAWDPWTETDVLWVLKPMQGLDSRRRRHGG